MTDQFAWSMLVMQTPQMYLRNIWTSFGPTPISQLKLNGETAKPEPEINQESSFEKKVDKFTWVSTLEMRT